MFDVLMTSTDTRARTLASRGLTPNDARALWTLSTEHGQPMNTLAQAWECDPSNVTFIIRRLEHAGLVQRRDSDADRRVKLIELTDKGRAIKEELMAEYRIPPPELLQLGQADLRALIEIFEKVSRADE